jgi:uncharacterized protein YkwD
MIYRFLVIFVFLISCGDAAAFERKSFMPENELWRHDSGIKNVSQGEFNGILDKIEAHYKPIIAGFGAQFSIVRSWEDSTVNAYADRSPDGKSWIIKMFGGMARRPEITVVGFGLVACHEIGHHIAGFPKYSGQWASNEGQSDYFSTFVCAKKVLADYPVPEIPEAGREKCDAAYTEQLDRETCYKSIAGGLSLSKLLAALGNTATPAIETPDTKKVSKTSDSHPAAQCRLDTYVAAATCAKSWDDKVIPTSAAATCDNRPRCWYAPSNGPVPPNPGPGPSPEPQPNPEPNGQADEVLFGNLNDFRSQSGSAALYPDGRLLCAALMHADDMLASKQCSPYGSDHSNHISRARACGYTGYVHEIFVCGAPSSSEALNYWLRNRFNRWALSSRAFSLGACARSGDVYSCVLGQ